MGNNITTADLLAVQRNITEANRADNVALRQEVTSQLGVVREEVGELRAAQRSQEAKLVELSTVIRERTKPLGVLTSRQRKALWGFGTAAGAGCLEGLRHFAGWAWTIFTHTGTAK